MLNPNIALIATPKEVQLCDLTSTTSKDQFTQAVGIIIATFHTTEQALSYWMQCITRKDEKDYMKIADVRMKEVFS